MKKLSLILLALSFNAAAITQEDELNCTILGMIWNDAVVDPEVRSKADGYVDALISKGLITVDEKGDLAFEGACYDKFKAAHDATTLVDIINKG